MLGLLGGGDLTFFAVGVSARWNKLKEDTAFVSDCLAKKGLQKLCSIFEGMHEK